MPAFSTLIRNYNKRQLARMYLEALPLAQAYEEAVPLFEEAVQKLVDYKERNSRLQAELDARKQGEPC